MRFPRIAAAALSGIGLVWVIAEAGGPPPPVFKDLGPVSPTPVPTEKAYDKKRLITSITVQNSPEGETIITFEASDVGRLPDGKYKSIASQRYSLTEVKPRNKALKDNATTDLRKLERALLDYVDSVGGPKERSTTSGSERPH